MSEATQIHEIEERLPQLRPEQLALLVEILRALASDEDSVTRLELLLAAESSLRKDWALPEEDVALADL